MVFPTGGALFYGEGLSSWRVCVCVGCYASWWLEDWATLGVRAWVGWLASSLTDWLVACCLAVWLPGWLATWLAG
jgi:hypothetical protein